MNTKNEEINSTNTKKGILFLVWNLLLAMNQTRAVENKREREETMSKLSSFIDHFVYISDRAVTFSLPLFYFYYCVPHSTRAWYLFFGRAKVDTIIALLLLHHLQPLFSVLCVFVAVLRGTYWFAHLGIFFYWDQCTGENKRVKVIRTKYKVIQCNDTHEYFCVFVYKTQRKKQE